MIEILVYVSLVSNIVKVHNHLINVVYM